MKKLLLSGFLLGFLFAGLCYLYGVPYAGACMSFPDTQELEKKLKQHVWHLSETIGERNYQVVGSLQNTYSYIHNEFESLGLSPGYQLYGRDFRNIIVPLPAGKFSDQDRKIVVGAHYDTVWLSPGADDNASGVAVLLELARILKNVATGKAIELVAFTNEEQPFAETKFMGSEMYLEQYSNPPAQISAMFSLEMLGYYSVNPGSQHYPFPLKYFYPETADFVAFVSNGNSVGLLWQSLSSFRRHSRFPVHGLGIPEKWVPDIRRSDHAQFWDKGIPALMLTDTAFYRNNRYHTVGDMPHTLNYRKMAEVTEGLACMLLEISVK